MLTRDPASWPRFPGPDAPEAVRLRWAVERFLPDRQRAPAPDTPTPAPPACGPDREVVPQLLGLPILPDFAAAGQCLEVRVPWLPETLWLVPAKQAVEMLLGEGISRGRVWTARELADLLSIPGLTQAGAQTVGVAKVAIAGELADVRVASRPASQRELLW
jgi:hypothetical protein